MSIGGGKTIFLAHVYWIENQMDKTCIDPLVYSTPCEIKKMKRKKQQNFLEFIIYQLKQP
jgi:hypothetical protein